MNITHFHDFSKNFGDFFSPGLEITILKFHDFSRFSMTVRTLDIPGMQNMIHSGHLVVVDLMQLDDVRVAVAQLQGGHFPLSLGLHPAAGSQITHTREKVTFAEGLLN